MLRELRVRNYAIIEKLSLGFGPGLNVLTGETGAGKSIIVGALGITLGQRAFTEMIKTGCGEAAVEAVFDMPSHPVLERLGIPSDEGIIIRRNIYSTGKTRAYINDTAVSVQSLAELGRTLVDVHGQHEHQSLLSAENQMRLLDQFGGLEPERESVSSIFQDVQALRRRLEDIRSGSRQRAQRLDLLKFQAGEIEAASVSEGEDTRLEEERGILSNISRLRELAESSYGLLYSEEGSCVERLSTVVSNLREVASIDQGSAGVLELLEQALPLVEDSSLSLRDLREKYHMEPGRLEAVEDRLELIGNLKRKYGDTIGQILEYRDSALRELSEMESEEENAGGLERELEEKEGMLEEKASALSSRRRRAAKETESAIISVLRGLALEKSEFRIDIRQAPVTSSGKDAVEFIFTANRGEALKPLNKVASGGELSRVMLAVKSVLRKADRIPVLVFDEVDAGIGGKTARNVAGKLREISEGRQVLCVTHLPQIASAADRHFLIEKGEKHGRTSVSIRELAGRARQEEVARMLSGHVTDKSMEHAKEIIERGA